MPAGAGPTAGQAGQPPQQRPSPAPSAADGTPVPEPPPPPLVLLLDGLGVYVENDYIGVSALARQLAGQGFRTRTDSHLMMKTKGIVPNIIIGHSMGGETALTYATQLARAGYPPPLVITIDAAPAPPACTVPRCVNIAGPGFLRVRGAQNISAWAAGARFTNHAQLPTHPAVQRLILQETANWMADWQAKQQAAEPSSRKEPAAPPTTPSSPPAPPAASSALPKMWSLPGWTVPNWPGLTRQGG